MVRWSPRQSAVYREMFGEQAAWGDQEHLSATLVDLMHLLVWMKSRDGQKGQNRPKPVPRPGAAGDDPGEKRIGEDAIDMDAFDDWWNDTTAVDADPADPTEST